MKIYLGADHAGFALKEQVKKKLAASYDVVDLGNTHFSRNDDYVDYARKVAEAVAGQDAMGILFCDTGVGMEVVANKVKGIRAVNATSELMASRAREHENANVLCLGHLFVKPAVAKRIVSTFLQTKPSRAARHQRRIAKIAALEKSWRS